MKTILHGCLIGESDSELSDYEKHFPDFVRWEYLLDIETSSLLVMILWPDARPGGILPSNKPYFFYCEVDDAELSSVASYLKCLTDRPLCLYQYNIDQTFLILKNKELEISELYWLYVYEQSQLDDSIDQCFNVAGIEYLSENAKELREICHRSMESDYGRDLSVHLMKWHEIVLTEIAKYFRVISRYSDISF